MIWKMYWEENYFCFIYWVRFKIRRNFVFKELRFLFSLGLVVVRKVYNVYFFVFFKDG